MAAVSAYKGKISTKLRGWAMLPAELMQYIATLSIISVNSQHEHGSTNSFSWPTRIVYNALRDAVEMERLMGVCMGWRTALESHLFWHHAVNAIDPHDTLAHYAIYKPEQTHNNSSSNRSTLTKSMPMPLAQHFRNIIRCSCLPCRLLHPHLSTGLTAYKTVYYYGPSIGAGGVCASHADPLAFCHICFRESGVCTNVDFESFPSVVSVCKFCRRYTRNWNDLCFDDESRRAIEGYINYGEGTARKVGEYCMDRAWLRRRTRIAEFIELVRANAEVFKVERAAAAYDSDDEMLDESEEEDEEEEAETIDTSARGMAMVNWARSRVLSGFWILPTDQWISPMPHPISLSRSRPFDDGEPPSVSHMDPPPSYSLCEHANAAFASELSSVLLPPLKNLVRRLVMQGGGPKDAERMTISEIGDMLREEGTWWEGWDWPRRRTLSDDGSDTARSSSTSSDSPVLSTSTLQTTPSPPPAKHREDEYDTTHSEPRLERQTFIPIAPVLHPPRQLRHVPWIPNDIESLSEGSRKVIMKIWRDACSPLYACDCNVCERARAPASPEATTQTIKLVPSQTEVYRGSLVFENNTDTIEPDEDVDGEADLEYEEEYTSESSLDEYVGDTRAVGRKRSIQDIDMDASEEYEVAVEDRPHGSPKRRRAAYPELEQEWEQGMGKRVVQASPTRKRSSEEVEALELLDGKRVKRGIDVV